MRECGRARTDNPAPAACPSLTRGRYAYDFGDTAGLTPLMKMHTLGHDFVPDPIHAGGACSFLDQPLEKIDGLGPTRTAIFEDPRVKWLGIRHARLVG